MPTPQAEADRASVAFHAALTEIGVTSLTDALALWEEVPPDSRPEVAVKWMRKALTLVVFHRRRSRDLALAYYRLVRALHTGTTIIDPREPEKTSVTLRELRSAFETLASNPQESLPPPPPSTDTEAALEATEETVEDEDEEADRILLEELAGLEEEERRLEEAALEEARVLLAALGPLMQEKYLEDLDLDEAAEDVDAIRKDAHDRAGARQASAAEKVVLDGARSTLWSLADKDKRAIGYVRLSRTGTPCGWCAMLISRGPVYRSEKSATYSEGDQYHLNCHCYAMPVFSPTHYASSALFDLNRKYAEEWPRVTRGLSGKAAVSAWRYYIRQQQKALGLEPNASPTNVQEA